jgi:hypothetical protein
LLWIFGSKRDGVTFSLAFIRSPGEADGFDPIGFSGVEPESDTCKPLTKNRLSKPFKKVVRRIATYNWVLLADTQSVWMEGRKKRIAPCLPCQLPEEHLSTGDDITMLFFQPFDEADGLT